MNVVVFLDDLGIGSRDHRRKYGEMVLEMWIAGFGR